VQTIIIHIKRHNVVEKFTWSVSKNNSVTGLSERGEIYNKTSVRTGRGELSYLAPLGSENISAPISSSVSFGVGGYYPPD